ncbi:MAG: hypothetical protein V2I33_19300, partial [Kangiellaceae bacterium]|nr:hypothetical protein [Kangiellaceae bacterium]
MDDDVFELTVAVWEAGFRTITETHSSTAVVRGAAMTYDGDEPWMSRSSNDLLQLYFDGTDDLLLIPEASAGKSALLLHHTMTISLWVFPVAPIAGVSMLSKLDESQTGTDVAKLSLEIAGTN